MRALITGGAGFIGSHLVDYLIDRGVNVTVIDDLSGGLEENINPKAYFYNGSIVDRNLVDKITKEQDVIYHLAAYAAEGLSHFVRGFNYINNLVGSVNLINSAVRNKVPKFLFTSSMAVYGSAEPPFDESMLLTPEDPYGNSKAAVENDLRIAGDMFDLNYVIIRPHNIYGERQFLGDPYRNVIGIFMNRIMQGKPPLVYGDGEQTRAFSYIEDILPCIGEAPFIKEAKNEVINLGAGKPYTLNELAEKVVKVMGNGIKPKHVSPREEVKHAYCTIDKSERLLGFKDKTSLDEGLRKMARWAKQKGPMEPIIWEGYEIQDKLPVFWKNLKEEYPNGSKRISAKEVYDNAFSNGISD